MNVGSGQPAKGRTLTPLLVISLFLSLSETVLVVAATRTAGWVQAALTVFVITFPVLVAAAFFVILWSRPYVFYPPHEYGQEVDVLRYVEAMQLRPLRERGLYDSIRQAVSATLSSGQIVSELIHAASHVAGARAEDNVSRVLADIGEKTLEAIRQGGFLTLDARLITGGMQAVQVPYDKFGTVSGLLDHIWITWLSGRGVPPFTYGRTWVLRDAGSKWVLRAAGRTWAQQCGRRLDDRSLESVGIAPGMMLEIALTHGVCEPCPA